ncbi:Uncharacterised protein [Serratia fonticola]|uniref:Uncharacterized protein n=1 Tax=Serratia fonticola TaxID=47917 RepID=A0A448SPI8_SERFO|nr:Uncharacterised protein [Serratia fonticola]CAI1913231.1 Uncharacterised protein [Serratia fonticola]CAI1958143.1 Uncharacterised protein [Serratia fonticola]VEI69619.1 Uncharacterised protein [Serratia fonticola]
MLFPSIIIIIIASMTGSASRCFPNHSMTQSFP